MTSEDKMAEGKIASHIPIHGLHDYVPVTPKNLSKFYGLSILVSSK